MSRVRVILVEDLIRLFVLFAVVIVFVLDVLLVVGVMVVPIP